MLSPSAFIYAIEMPLNLLKLCVMLFFLHLLVRRFLIPLAQCLMGLAVLWFDVEAVTASECHALKGDPSSLLIYIY